MQRILLITFGLLILIFGSRAAYRALASDETKLLWKLEAIEQGYNEGDVGDTLGPVAKDWSHEGYPGATRDNAQSFLAQRSFTGRDRETKELLFRMAIDWETLVIVVDGDRATTEFEIEFPERKDGEWAAEWSARAICEWENGPNGWFLKRSSHEDLQGTSASL